MTIETTELGQLTGLEDFTEERMCTDCSSSICPAKRLVQFGMTETTKLVARYPCFVKAFLLSKTSVNEVRHLLGNPLLQYVGIKTQAVARTTTRRGSYANLGTLLIMLNDYLQHAENYQEYEGIKFSEYMINVRELPGCSKIQNHAINHRLNEEFKKFFRHVDVPIVRIPVPGSPGATIYKLNVELLDSSGAKSDPKTFAGYLSSILQLYFHLREVGNREVVEHCLSLMEDTRTNEETIVEFFKNAIRHDDARMFQIAAFVTLKEWYSTESIVLGKTKENIKEVPLILYRTGRVNANDGGIDYVLTPLGKYFQATQDFNFEKYFLDIDKLARYPISFVIQTEETSKQAFERIKKDAEVKYSNPKVLNSYLKLFEAVFTLIDLDGMLNHIIDLPQDVKALHFKNMLEEFIRQFQVEYNIEEN